MKLNLWGMAQMRGIEVGAALAVNMIAKKFAPGLVVNPARVATRRLLRQRESDLNLPVIYPRR